MILYLFTNQLFEARYIPEVSEIYLIEDPIFYGDRKITLRFNILKLQYQRLALLQYKKYLEKNGYKVSLFNVYEVKYPLKKETNVLMFDPVDHELKEKVLKSVSAVILDNPNFLLSKEQLKTYKGSSHASFYKFIKKHINILVGEKSHDAENRCKLPRGIDLPKLQCHEPDQSELGKITKYIKKQKYAYREYPDQELIFPYTHGEAKKWVSRFLKQRLSNFGKYQDAISSSDNFVFHSCISPMVNLGLIQPSYILQRIKKYKSKVPMNSYEGFIRQLIGWREYQRYTYVSSPKSLKTLNFFNQSKKISTSFYTATTGIDPVDKTIRSAFKYGYLHHIERLMVMGNFMTLNGIKPIEQYKWFMEFSLDSYDWVMYQNILMISYADGGKTTRKPYLSSSNYIIKMSDYKKGEWSKKWDKLFYGFLMKNKDKLRKTVYARHIKHYENKAKTE